MQKQPTSFIPKASIDSWIQACRTKSLAERRTAIINLVQSSLPEDKVVIALLETFADADPDVKILMKGYFLGLASTLRDLTLQNDRLQDELSKTKSVLEQEMPSAVQYQRALADRTTEIDAAKQELDQFLYVVSHDLRAPLRQIEGMTEILKATGTSVIGDELFAHINSIGTNASTMGRLMDELLHFARVGRAELKKSRVDLNNLVKEVCTDLQGAVEDRKIQWELSPLPEVDGDRALLREIFHILIDNALKFTRCRALARIQIGVAPGQLEQIIFVRDNGVGFDMRYVSRLFAPFQRLHRASEFEGFGVGLAVVRRIIDRHGGRTWAEAEPGQGASFYFALPASQHRRI